uniref:hypothetical protein n=1 Tax=Thaumasiovibrio occultus TaxID=1891184 RepID=UPI000B360A81|nr:hypothetical protein [Thaumasiovibrio occultus]
MKTWLQAQQEPTRGDYGYSDNCYGRYCDNCCDSTDDLPMLKSDDYPFAVNPDPALMLSAKANEWSIMEWHHEHL